MLAAEQNRSRVEDLLRSLYASSNIEGERDYITELSGLIRQGNGPLVLDAIKGQLKRGSPAEQINSMTILDQLMLNSVPQFVIMLSSDKWTERFFKVSKSCSNIEVTCKIMSTLIIWYKRYHTGGFQRCLQRFSRSKGLGDTFAKVHRQFEAEQRSSVTTSRKQSSATAQAYGDRHHIPTDVETIILEAQGDLASLEYALEHPHVLQDGDVANECKQRKMQCMRLLETGNFESFEPELMQIIERFSEALELFEAINGVDVGEGEQARMRAVNEGVDSEEDEHQERIRKRVAPKQNAEQVMLQAQQATQEILERERNESAQVRGQLEELRRKHEELQNKYKDAKSKNRDAVAALEQYADRIEFLENGKADGSAEAPAAQSSLLSTTSTAKEKLSLLVESGRRMRNNVQGIRQTLREIREQYARDIRRESEYYSSQLSSAVLSIIAAAQQERSADHKALHWTQELYKKEMRLRKQYYNAIQELKGNIRVYCRVRPMLPKELTNGHTNTITFPSTDELKVVDSNGRPKLYEFDEVYPPEAPQSKVFEDTSPLIDSVVDGYNVCIFAYGQTGTGKTHTMGGGNDNESKGINTRALERLFDIIEERKETEVSTVTVSILEIYIETIRDLLASKKDAAKLTYEVKQGGPFGTYVSNLSEVTVSTPSEIYKIMERANMNRSEGQTNMNEHSSRSHMIVYIIVRTRNKQTGIQSYGKLSLVDLAGSERLDKSGAEGQLVKEAVAINKSLSSLGDVISGLSQNSKHVPFRNSTLTYLLQDSMAGQAKVLMFVCVSPASYNSSETNSSLQFATRARGVMFGQVKKNPTMAS